MTTTSRSIRTAITKPLERVFSSAYLSADQTALTASSWNKITLDTTSIDLGSNFDTTNHKFIAPVNGLYHIEVLLTFTDASVIATKSYLAGYYKNGSLSKSAKCHSSVADGLTIAFTDEVYLNKDDYIELYANPIAGANTVAVRSGLNYTTLTIRLVTKEGIRT